jgi:hypothetical protein
MLWAQGVPCLPLSALFQREREKDQYHDETDVTLKLRKALGWHCTRLVSPGTEFTMSLCGESWAHNALWEGAASYALEGAHTTQE